MFGGRVKYDHKRRCAFCNKAVDHGYLVNDQHLRGFFCSAPHAQLAYENRVETAKKEGIPLEEES